MKRKDLPWLCRAASSVRRREEEAAVGFTASQPLAEALQQILVDLIELHLQGKQARWNLIGRNFRGLQRQLDQIVDVARDASDTVAERMRAVGAVPDARSETVAAHTTLPSFPEGEQDPTAAVDMATGRLRAATHTARALHYTVDREDPATTDLLHVIIDILEKHAWMVSAENRTARHAYLRNTREKSYLMVSQGNLAGASAAAYTTGAPSVPAAPVTDPELTSASQTGNAGAPIAFPSSGRVKWLMPIQHQPLHPNRHIVTPAPLRGAARSRHRARRSSAARSAIA
jgi:starvation-inducible DNA-binding protein